MKKQIKKVKVTKGVNIQACGSKQSKGRANCKMLRNISCRK